MEVILATTDEHLQQIINMAEHHPAVEYDCSFDKWKMVFINMFRHPLVKSWIAFDDNRPIGYVVGIRENILRNQISIFDVYLNEEWRGQNLVISLLTKIKEWAVEDHVLRVQWTSKYSTKKWERILQKLNIEVDRYNTFVWEV